MIPRCRSPWSLSHQLRLDMMVVLGCKGEKRGSQKHLHSTAEQDTPDEVGKGLLSRYTPDESLSSEHSSCTELAEAYAGLKSGLM